MAAAMAASVNSHSPRWAATAAATAPPRATRPCRRMSQPPTAPPSSPAARMPKTAEATPTVCASATPMSSNVLPKASAVAGPPASVVDPAMMPRSGLRPRALAERMPTAFCNSAPARASARQTSTVPLSRRSRPTLARRPMVVKKASVKRSRRSVSNSHSTPAARSSETHAASKRPPVTGRGMFQRSKRPTRPCAQPASQSPPAASAKVSAALARNT